MQTIIDWTEMLPKGYKVAYKLCPNADDDILSVVHDAAIYALMKYDPVKGQSFESYFCMVTWSKVLTALKKRRIVHELGQCATLPNLNVYEAIDGLPYPYNDIAHDTYVEKLSVRELRIKYKESQRGMVRKVNDVRQMLRDVLS